MKKFPFLNIIVLLSLAILLDSCSALNDRKDSVEYLAVQTDEDGYWSIINSEGEFIVKEEYAPTDKIGFINEGIYWVQNDKGEYQLFSTENPKKALNKDVYTQVTEFNNGRAFVSDGKSATKIIDTDGAVVKELPSNILAVITLSNNGTTAFLDINTQKVGAIDTDGDVVTEAIYDGILACGEDFNLFIQKKGDETTTVMVDINGKVIGNFNMKKYELRGSIFSEGLIAVCDKEADYPELRFMNEDGEIVFTIDKSVAERDTEYNVVDGYVVFSNKDDKWGVANIKGEEVIRPKYRKLYNIGKGRFIAQKEDKYGIIDSEDNIILDFDYSEIMTCKLGDNYIVKDGSTFIVVTDKDEKAFKGDFHKVNLDLNTSPYIVYEDPQTLANMILGKIEETSFNGYKAGVTGAQMAKEFSLTADEIGTGKSYIYQKLYDLGSNPRFSYRFSDNLVEAITHTEGSGWSRRRVVDGYQFKDTHIDNVSIRIDTYSMSVETSDLSQTFRKGLEDKGFKLSAEQSDLYQKGNTKVYIEEKGTYLVLTYDYPSIDTAAMQTGSTQNSDVQATETSASTEQTTSGSNTNNDFAWLSTRLATPADIEGMSRADIRIMRNAIFAMHGYKFRDKQLAELFSNYSWYKPMYSDVTSRLNKIEQQNIAFLKKHE